MDQFLVPHSGEIFINEARDPNVMGIKKIESMTVKSQTKRLNEASVILYKTRVLSFVRSHPQVDDLLLITMKVAYGVSLTPDWTKMYYFEKSLSNRRENEQAA